MTTLFPSLVRIAAPLVIVTNLVTAVVAALTVDPHGGLLLALAAATFGPLLVVVVSRAGTGWVLGAFATSLIGNGVAFGFIGLGTLASPTLVFALAVDLLVCVAATFVRAQDSLAEPGSRL